jgi:predicted nucleotidyltransferase
VAKKKQTSNNDNVAVLQEAGVVAKKHQMTKSDVDLLNSLNKSEVDALISIKGKLGDAFLKKVSKGGKFPHPLSASF